LRWSRIAPFQLMARWRISEPTQRHADSANGSDEHQSRETIAGSLKKEGGEALHVGSSGFDWMNPS